MLHEYTKNTWSKRKIIKYKKNYKVTMKFYDIRKNGFNEQIRALIYEWTVYLYARNQDYVNLQNIILCCSFHLHSLYLTDKRNYILRSLYCSPNK
jgi:hypothetical protein